MTELVSRGFIVIHDFLSDEELSLLLSTYDSMDKPHTNKNYNVSIAPLPESIEAKCKKLAKSINELTNIKVDETLGYVTYFDTDVMNLKWHQDHEPYYRWQDAYNFLSFWMPLIKPNPEESGLSVVPFDVLREIDNDFVENILWGTGAKYFDVDGSRTHWTDDDTDDDLEGYLNINIDTISVSPKMSPKDLLIFRGDTIHRTQNGNTHRLSISTRMINSSTMLSRDKFNSTNPMKRQMIDFSGEVIYRLMRSKFNTHSEFEAKELIQMRNVIQSIEKKSGKFG